MFCMKKLGGDPFFFSTIYILYLLYNLDSRHL